MRMAKKTRDGPLKLKSIKSYKKFLGPTTSYNQLCLSSIYL